MAQHNIKIKSSPPDAAQIVLPPSAAEFSEYTATMLAELSKSAESYGLPVLARLMDLARTEALHHIPQSGPDD